MLIHLIAAARPNFMKIAPLYHELKREAWADPVIVHTGQHYDINMSEAFFRDLSLPEPHIHLGVGSGTHAEQVGRVMMAYEKVLMDGRPDLVVVVGDVNSTMACTIAASKVSYTGPFRRKKQSEHNEPKRPNKLDQPDKPIVAHLEAGLRSFDRTMPEEINRVVTDSLSDILWTPSPDADENLAREGVPREKIDCVGNIMIDSLEMLRDKIEEQAVHKEFGLNPGRYAVVTLHRPSNVDDQEVLKEICKKLGGIAKELPIVFPIHPRTRKSFERNELMGLLNKGKEMHLMEPLSYIRFMNLVFNCSLVITDSGGIQEETTYLGIPCLTLRENTERPITVTEGTNRLCSIDNLEEHARETLRSRNPRRKTPKYWDGKTAPRIVGSIKRVCHFSS
jgi:UDP-N-acetylglucosamine 2-epimerase (non-hydrolysing)